MIKNILALYQLFLMMFLIIKNFILKFSFYFFIIAIILKSLFAKTVKTNFNENFKI